MLTVPGLCWLCRMPLALSAWGVCSVCTGALLPEGLSAMRLACRQPDAPLWSMPEKSAAVERAGGGG